jgi:hypothetical protein
MQSFARKLKRIAKAFGSLETLDLPAATKQLLQATADAVALDVIRQEKARRERVRAMLIALGSHGAAQELGQCRAKVYKDLRKSTELDKA